MPGPESNSPQNSNELRRLAEAKAAEGKLFDEPLSPEEMSRLLHELRVHQVELGMQNEALRDSQLELERSRDKYAELYDSAPIGYLTLDESGVIGEINLTACGMLGGNRSRFLEKHLINYIARNDKNRFLAYLRRWRGVIDDDDRSIQVDMKSVGGAGVPVQISMVPAVDAHTGCRRYLVAVTDLSEVRRAEQRLRLALEAGEMGLWHWDIHKGEAFWNEREFRLLGLAPKPGPVDPKLFFDHIHPDDVSEMEGLVATVLDNGRDLRHHFRVVCEDGEVRWLSSLGRLFRDDDGRPANMIGVNFDITETKDTEVTLEAAKADLEFQVAERTSALQMLRDVAAAANRSQNVEDAFQFTLQRVAEHNGWCFGHTFLPSDHDPDRILPAYVWYSDDAERFASFRQLTLETVFRRGYGLPGRVFETGRPEWGTNLRDELGPRRIDLAEQLGIKTAAAFPILVEEEVVGVLEFFSRKAIEPTPQLLESMASIGTQLGRVIERKRFQIRLLNVAEEQQRQLGQELLDDIGQELTGLALNAETLAEHLADDGSRCSSFARQIVEALNRVQTKTRTLAHGLIPVDIEAPIIEAALEDLALKTDATEKIACRFRRRGKYRIQDARTATQLFRIAQEAVTNVLQHAQANHLEIELKTDTDSTLLSIRDDGVGLPGDRQHFREMGLRIMEHRAASIGAVLAVESRSPSGTEVTCRVTRNHVEPDGGE